MRQSRRRAVSALAVIAIVLGGFIAGALPAQALTWYGTMCKGFTACTTAGYSNAGYSAVYTQSFWYMYSGHNCTNYAAYRLQQRGIADFITAGHGNATDWGSQASAKGIAVDMNTPQPGDIAWWDSSKIAPVGHVAYVESVNVSAGTFVVSEDNSSSDFDWRTYRLSEVSGFIHTSTMGTIPNGAFIAYNGAVYRMVGGAPLYVRSWSAYGGTQPYIRVTATQFNAMRSVPVDGTYITSQQTGDIYVIAGGAPLYVTSWSAVGGARPALGVDETAISGAGGAGVLSHLAAYPANGTYVYEYANRRTYRIVGGAPLYLSTWAAVGGRAPAQPIDGAAIEGAGGAGPWSHLRQYPVDGSRVIDQTGAASVFVGGAPLRVTSLADIGATTATRIDNAVFAHADTAIMPWKNVRSHPADGAYLAVPGAAYRTVGGAAMRLSTWSAVGGPQPYTRVSTATLANAGGTGTWGFLLAKPSDGAMIETMPSASFYTYVGGFWYQTAPADGAVILADSTALPSTARSAKPVITGTVAVGQVVTVKDGSWAPAPITITHQWFRNGEAIAGETGTTHKIVAADAGQQLTVVSTGGRAGLISAAATSAAVTVPKMLTATPTPKISGTPVPGATLTASAGTWSPAPVALKYQWYRAGSPITGATTTTYKPLTTDVGASITVRVTGSKSGYTSITRTSAGVVVKLALTATPTPTISGTATAGSVLTATPGTWTPGPVTLSYQWYRSGTPIAGATAATYTLTTTDRGTSITVVVTGSKSGYLTVARRSAALAIPRVLTAAPTPVITGAATAGATLTAKPGTWSPAPVTLAYRWYRNGVALTGATAATYTLTTADRGTAITVVVTGSKSGYLTVSRRSAAFAVPNVLTATPTPVIAGAATVGTTLTAQPGSWTPAPVTLAYQWYRNGAAIAGATAATYTLVAADHGTAITVRVTGSKTGYLTVVKASAATALVQ
ncbi:MAG TPA: CHAP domain-containing protein [Microbacterium sp.]|uniref:CHAP domain-containing protein n=1 Tax=Microbacterium sp. TaxID=51671 RepID=UPI002B4823FF|nr:CHAP domain-containing protein [Microbacterium sp.]HKT56928.1 CHAP domain-containing protein [Microbacterium sp.]